MAAAAVPLLIQAGSSLLGGAMGKRSAASAQKAAGQRSPEELQLLQSSMASGRGMEQGGQQLAGQALPAIGRGMGYFNTLLNGNRSEMQQATAPEAGRINALYKGNDRNLQRMGINGGEARMARAEAARMRTGQMAGLVGQVRPGAAQQLMGAGGQLLGEANNMRANGARVMGGLLNNSTDNRQKAYAAGQEAGQRTAGTVGKLGTLVADGVGTWMGQRKSGGGGNGQSYEPNDDNGWG